MQELPKELRKKIAEALASAITDSFCSSTDEEEIEDVEQESLVGAKIKKVYVNKTKVQGYTLFDVCAVLLDTSKGFYSISVGADCCSDGYIDHIELPYEYDMEMTGEITEVRAMPNIEAPAASKQSVDKIYGLCIQLRKGGALIFEYRNSSNGYYGSYHTIAKVAAPDMDEWVELTESF